MSTDTLEGIAGWGLLLRPDDRQKLRDLADPLHIPPPERPIARIQGGSFADTTTVCLKALFGEVYVRGGHLVREWRPYDPEYEPGLERAPDQLQLIVVTVAWLMVRLTELVRFERINARDRKWVQTDCPRALADAILNLGDWPTIRPVDALKTAPFFRKNGTVCDGEGYDAQSRTLVRHDVEHPSLETNVSVDAAFDSLHMILEPFREFPYKNPAAESAFAAHVLTEAVRMAMAVAPMFFYTAPDAGTGKSLLSAMPSLIVHGVQPALRPWPRESEEMRKVLASSLYAGEPSINFDNIQNGLKIRESVLCAFLTSTIWRDRKLGTNESLTFTNCCVVSGSGNNITPTGDMARRSMVVRLDANRTERERRQRVFRIDDLPAYVLKNRVGLLMSALRIIRGHQQSGHKGPQPLASFEAWSRLVRDALIWLEMPDPIETQEQETDSESCGVDAAFSLLAPHLTGKKFGAEDVCNLATRSFSDTDGSIAAALREAGCSDPSSPRSVGYWLRERRDQLGAGYKLEQQPTTGSNSKKYRFRSTGPDPVQTDNRDLIS